MVPDSRAQKRKRGRPPNASKQHANASRPQSSAREDRPDDGDAEERPRKRGKMMGKKSDEADGPSRRRGRPRKSTDEVVVEHHEEESSPPAPLRKRGRPRKSTGEVVEEQHEQESSPPAPSRRRGRPRKSTDEVVVEHHEEEQSPPVPSRKRGRPRKSTGEVVEEQHEQESSPPAPSRTGRRRKAEQPPERPDELPSGEEAPRRKRDRPPLQKRKDDSQAEEERPSSQQPEHQAAKPRKRGRPSSQAASPLTAQKEARKTGKPRRGAPSADEEETVGQEVVGRQHQKQKRGRGRPSADKSSISRKEAPQTSPQRRRRSSQIAEPEEQQPPDQSPPELPSPPRPYVHVAPHVRRVRQSAITAKWSPLTGPSHSAASTLLHLAHRPILQRLSNTHQRRAHTSAALRLMTHRIARKVSRGLPFPPSTMPATSGAGQADGGRETELDFEAVLDGKALLEAQLGPTAHAVELLRREKQRIERELERDYEMLRGLEAGARAQAREQRGLLKKAHALAPEAKAQEEQSKKEVLFTHDKETSSRTVFADMADDELRPLAVQLGGHLESMRTNLQQTEGILPQLCRSQATLQAVLLQHLGQSQYERVVLG